MAKNVFDAEDFVNAKSFEQLKKTMESFFQVMDKGFKSFGKSLTEIKRKQMASKTAFDNSVKSLDKLQKAAISQTRITNNQKKSMRALRDEILKNAQAYQKYDKVINTLNNTLKNEKKGVDSLKNSYDKMRKNVEGNVKATKDNAKATKESVDANVDLAKKVRELEKAYIAARQAGDDVTAGKLKKELKETTESFIKIKNEVNAVKKEIRDSEKETNQLSTAYSRLKSEARDAANEARELGSKLGTSSPEFLKAAKRAKDLSDKLKEIESGIKGTKDNTKATKENAVANVDLTKRIRGLEKAYIAARQAGDDVAAGKLKKELKETAESFIKIKNEVNAVKKEIREQEKLANKTSTAYGKLSQEYLDAAKAAKNYAAELGETHPKSIQAIKDAKRLKDRLDSIDQSVGDFRRNVGNYKSALEGFRGATMGGVDATGMLFDALGGAAGKGGLKGALTAVGGPYAVAAAGAVALGAGVAKSIKVFANFEKEITRVGALKGLNTATEEGRMQMEALSEKAKELGSTTVFSASEAAKGMQFLAMAGFDTNAILSATPAVLNLASAAQIDMSEAADITSNVLSGMGMKVEDTGRLIDVLAKTTTSANTNMSQLGEAMKVFAPIANTLGISVEEAGAAVGILGDNGLQGTVATQSLGSALGRLADPTKKQAKAAKELGIEVFNQKGEFVGLAGFVDNFAKATKNMTKQEKLAATQKIIGAEAQKSFLALLNAEKKVMVDGTEQTLKGADALRGFTEELLNSEGAAQKMADMMNDTLDGAYKGLQSSLEGLAIEVGGGFDEIGKNVLKGLTEVVRFFTDMYKEAKLAVNETLHDLSELGSFVMDFVKIFTDLLGITDWITEAFNSLSDAFNDGTEAAGGTRNILMELLSFIFPVTKEFKVFSLAIKGMRDGFEKAIPYTKAMIAAFKVFYRDGIKPVLDWLGKFDDWVAAKLRPIAEMFEKFFDSVTSKINNGVTNVSKFFNELINDIAKLVKPLTDLIGSVGNTGDGIVKSIRTSINKMISEIVKDLKGLLESVIDLLPEKMRNSLSSAISEFDAVYDSATKKIDDDRKKEAQKKKADEAKAKAEAELKKKLQEGNDPATIKAKEEANKKAIAKQKEVNAAIVKARVELDKTLAKSNIDRLNKELEDEENSIQERINIYNEINNIQIKQAEKAAEVAKKEAKEKSKSQEEYALEVEKIELELADKKETINRETTDSIKSMQDELLEKQKEIAAQVIEIEQETKDIKDEIKDLETEASIRALDDQIDLNNQRLENEKLSLDERLALIAQNAELEMEIQREVTKQALQELEKRRLAEINSIDDQMKENARLAEEQPELAVDLFKKNKALIEQRNALEEKYATERVMLEQESANTINEIQTESTETSTALLEDNAQRQREFVVDTLGGGFMSAFEDSQQKRIDAIEDEDKKLKQQLLLKLQMMTLEIALAKIRNPEADVTGQVSSLGSTAIAGLLGGGLYEGGYTGNSSLFTDMNGRKAVDFVHENEWVASAKVAKVNAKSANIVKHLEAFQRTGNEVFIDKITGKYDDYANRDIQLRYELNNPTTSNMDIDYDKLGRVIANQIPRTDIRKEADGHVFREKTSRSLKEIKLKDRIKRYRLGS